MPQSAISLIAVYIRNKDKMGVVSATLTSVIGGTLVVAAIIAAISPLLSTFFTYKQSTYEFTVQCYDAGDTHIYKVTLDDGSEFWVNETPKIADKNEFDYEATDDGIPCTDRPCRLQLSEETALKFGVIQPVAEARSVSTK